MKHTCLVVQYNNKGGIRDGYRPNISWHHLVILPLCHIKVETPWYNQLLLNTDSKIANYPKL